ncbi:MAG: ATP-binding protein, partial [Gammaproteobacteria bacterium]
MASLHTRILLAATLVLAGFFGVTGLVLDSAYRHSAESALQERLQGYAYALVAVMEPDAAGEVHITNALPIPRLFTPGSGLYGRVTRNDGHHAWVSPSAADLEIPFPAGLRRGERRFRRLKTAGGLRLYTFNIGVSWQEAAAPERSYTFSVAEELSALEADISGFRRTLWGALGMVAAVLLAVQGLILRWGLRPLRRVATELRAIETGVKSRLEGAYPRELRGLTDNLNALIRSEREHLQRFRNALDDLAHSLKTPLALLRSTVETCDSPDTLRRVVEEQVARMSCIIEYQLQRGATSGPSAMAAPVALRPLVEKVVQALDKVYADKAIRWHIQVAEGLHFPGDESDLMEVLGNLLDNACKWCRQDIIVSVHRTAEGLGIVVEDDGPGIAAHQVQDLLRRGGRGDDQVPGHRIGLA